MEVQRDSDNWNVNRFFITTGSRPAPSTTGTLSVLWPCTGFGLPLVGKFPLASVTCIICITRLYFSHLQLMAKRQGSVVRAQILHYH